MAIKFNYMAIKNAKPQDKPYKIMIGEQFYVYVATSGKKTWRTDWKLNGKRNTSTHGVFPYMSYKDALEEHLQCKNLVKAGINPNPAKKEAAAAQKQELLAKEKTFEIVATEWLDNRMSDKSAKYRHDTATRLKNHVIPSIGHIPFAELTRQALLMPLRNVEARQAYDMAHRLAQIIGSVCKFAMDAGYVQYGVAPI